MPPNFTQHTISSFKRRQIGTPNMECAVSKSHTEKKKPAKTIHASLGEGELNFQAGSNLVRSSFENFVHIQGGLMATLLRSSSPSLRPQEISGFLSSFQKLHPVSLSSAFKTIFICLDSFLLPLSHPSLRLVPQAMPFLPALTLMQYCTVQCCELQWGKGEKCANRRGVSRQIYAYV